MTKDGPVFVKAKIKGDVKYPPFELNLGEEIYEEMRKFGVYPLGQIIQYPRHIPYNSEKKDFLEKTGRESFEGIYPVTYFSLPFMPQEDITNARPCLSQ